MASMPAAVYKFAAAADGGCGLWFRWLCLQLKRKVPLLGWEWLMASMPAAKYKLAAAADGDCICNWNKNLPLWLSVAYDGAAYGLECLLRIQLLNSHVTEGGCG